MSAVLWTAEQVAEALGTAGADGWTARGVSIDSRTLESGELFVALAGPRHDGHDHVGAALSAGAPAAIVARTPAGLPNCDRLIVVPDTLDALRRLGKTARSRAAGRLAAVTGSVGKTGTKEALRLALAAQGETHASLGSFNNHVGVPLTLARLPVDAAYAVFEIGMNHVGEIEPLVRLVRPHVVIVTNVEPVHLEFFPDNGLDGIAEAKAEIFEAGGETAVLNRDNAYFDFLAARARSRGFTHVIGFGAHDTADARLLDAVVGPVDTNVVAALDGRRVTYRIGAAGLHWALNSLAVLAAVNALGADLAPALSALERMTPPKGRGQRHHVPCRGGTCELIDDAYNASPVSMRAAFAVLGAIAPGRGGRRIAVLGDMLELGPDSPRMHADLAGALVAQGVDLVFTCGRLMSELDAALPHRLRGAHAVDSRELAPLVKGALRAGDVVLVKGSLGSRMGHVVETLLAANGNSGGDDTARTARASRVVNG